MWVCLGLWGWWRLRFESVEFVSGDVVLRGLVFVPDRVPAPALIVCHGFDRRGFRGYGIFEQLARKACESGFVSLVFDFRGCGGSGGRFDYGWGEQGDLEAAIGFLLSRREVDSDSVFVVGHSLGGAVALYVALRDKRVNRIVLWATPSDHAYNVKKFISRTRGRFSYYLFLLISYLDAVINVSNLFSLHVYGISLRPRDVRQRLMKLRENEVVAKLQSVNLLIVNGSGDQIVGLEEAKMNYKAAKELKELVIIESANHSFHGKEEETVDRTISWLVKQRQFLNRD